MKNIRFLVLSALLIALFIPAAALTEDLNDVAYESRIHLQAGTIWNYYGNGDCLLFPYYDVRKAGDKNQVTQINIENFGEYGVAAKLRFRDWARGNEIFSKDIWIPSKAVWSASVEMNEDGSNAIITGSGNVVWRYDSKTFYFTNSLLNGTPFLTKNIRKRLGESTLYGFVEVIGEEKTSPDDTGGKTARLAKSEQDCPNTLRGTLSITRVEDGITMAYDAIAIGNFSRGQGSLFRKPGSPYPVLSNSEDTLDQLEFQLSKWEVFGPFSVTPSNQGKTSFIVTFPTKQFHYPKGIREDKINNPFEAPVFTPVSKQGETLKTSFLNQGVLLPADSEITLPFSVNVIGLYLGSGSPPTGIDNLSLPTFSYDSGEVKLTSDGMAQRILIQDYEYFKEMFTAYRGMPALGLILREYRSPNAQGANGLNTSLTPVEFSAVWEESSLESILFPTFITGPSAGKVGDVDTYTTGGASSTIGHPIQYYFDWGDGNNSGWLNVGVTSAQKTWNAGGVFVVRSKARCAVDTTIESKWSQNLVVVIESISAPQFLTGPVTGIPNTLYTYTTGGAATNTGNPVQYFFDWGDGTDSNWLAVGVTSAQKAWPTGGTYNVKARARDFVNPTVVSADTTLVVKIDLISPPSPPVGPATANVGDTSTYMTGGASSNIGDPVEYQFDWGDGTLSGWLIGGATSAQKTWTKGGNFSVTAQARDATYPSVVSLPSGALQVTVNNPKPTLTSISPNLGYRLQTLDVVFSGTNFISGVSLVTFGAGITVNSTTVNSSTSITANITITAAAATGARDVSVTNAAPGGGTATLTNGFTVFNPAPTTTSISPTNTNAGGPSFSLTVNGTNFVQNSVVLFNNAPRVTTFVSGTQLSAAILNSDLTTAGPFYITVFNPAPGGGTSNAQTFTVNNPGPTLSSVSPNSGNRLQTLNVTLTGSNFINGSSVSFGAGINVNSVVVSGGASITANITITAAAATGPRDVSVTNAGPGGGTATLTGGFTVNNPVPTLTNINPNAGSQGATLDVTLTGTNFISGVSSVGFGPNIAVSITVNSSTSITAHITIDAAAATGPRGVSVTNPTPGGGTATLAGGFTVN